MKTLSKTKVRMKSTKQESLDKTHDKETTLRIGVLLGGGITQKGTLPESEKIRANAALKMIKNNELDVVILSGGQTRKHINTTEADLLQRHLLKKGINPHKLVLEKVSRDTIGNAIQTKRILNQKYSTIRKIILISSRYHLLRARWVFKRIYSRDIKIKVRGTNESLWTHKKKLLGEPLNFLCDLYVLGQVKKGDDKKAEKLIKKTFPIYKTF